jgi:NTE family protein
VGSDLLTREELHSALGISLQMVTVLIDQNVHRSLDLLSSDDVLIRPDLGDFSSANFAGAMPLIEKGEAAARAQAEVLRRYSVSSVDYRVWRESVFARLPIVPPVKGVRVVNQGEHVNPQVLEHELAEVPGIDLRRRP